MSTITIHEAVKVLGASNEDGTATRARDMITAAFSFESFTGFVKELGPRAVLEGRDAITEMGGAVMNDRLCTHLVDCFKIAADYNLPVADYLTAKAERKMKDFNEKEP